MEQRYEELVPNEEALLRAILESACSSISGEQAMPAGEDEREYSRDPEEAEPERV